MKATPPVHTCVSITAALALIVGCASTPELPAPMTTTAPASIPRLTQVPFVPDTGSVGIRCGSLIDGLTDETRDDMLVVIRAGRIAAVSPYAAASAPAELPLLDLTGSTCLPGLIDMHTHLTDRPEDTADLRVYFSRDPDTSLTLGKHNAAATLLAGFTSVRNVGTYVLGADIALRDAVNRGTGAGPRMQVSGPYLTIPQGGGDLYIPDFKEPADNARFHAGVARGAQQFRARAAALIASGSDVLKVIASGAVLAFGGIPGAPEMTFEEIAAVVKVAHGAGKKVAAHAHGAESIRMAIAAGVDTIEHASYLDEECMTLALQHGRIALAMDVYNGDYIETEGRRQRWPEEFLRKNLETTEIQRAAFTRAVARGVPIVFATDSGVFTHGLNARQFPIMVARGMTPMQAIKAATSVSAQYMGWESNVGAITPGRYGDLIAVRGDPLANIELLQQVDVVLKGGLLFKQD